MAPTHLLLGVLLCLCSVFSVEAGPQEPDVVYTKFAPRQGSLYFFANSTSALYADSWINGTIHVTHDDGKTWFEADLPSNVRKDIIMHPFDSHYALVETSNGPSYRTTDQGLTWQPFEVFDERSYSTKRFSFHTGPDASGYILMQRNRCVPSERLGQRCYNDYYYTLDGFASEPILLLENAQDCQFAHSTKNFVHDEHHDLIFCQVTDWSDSSPYSSRLLASSDFFNNDKRVVDFGLGSTSYNAERIEFIGRFAIVKLHSESRGDSYSRSFITSDLKHWEQLHFCDLQGSFSWVSTIPLSRSKLGVYGANSMLSDALCVSDANGNNFVESLKSLSSIFTLRPLTLDSITSIEHVGVVQILDNPRAMLRSSEDTLRSRITFDSGSSWTRLSPTVEDASGLLNPCDPADEENCSLHLHRQDRSVFLRTLEKGKVKTSSPSPGVDIRVGSIGSHLAPYKDCDTFITTNAGRDWKMLMKGPHVIEYVNSGSLIVLMKAKGETDEVHYSNDSGQSWNTLKLEYRIHPVELSATPDSISQKLLLVGRIALEEEGSMLSENMTIVSLDFSSLRGHECTEGDLERWFVRDGDDNECILGRKQWYMRRKIGRDCYVGPAFKEAEVDGAEEGCPCTEADYECDFNYVKEGNKCVPAVPETIPPGACRSNSGKYLGPSGYRLKAENTCNKETRITKDQPVEKDCAPPQLNEGEVGHKMFEFPAEIVQSDYLKGSQTIIVRLRDGTVWQSLNEGYTWTQLFPEERFLAFMMHPYAPSRAYLLMRSSKYMYTTDHGRSWYPMSTPLSPNTFGAPALAFSPKQEFLIWIGDADCSGNQGALKCHTEAYYSTDHGRNWTFIESYVRRCDWAEDVEFGRSLPQITCHSYKEKSGNQRHINDMTNPVKVVSGKVFYDEKRILLQNVVGFWRSKDYILAAQVKEDDRSLGMQVSRDMTAFSEAVFPTGLHPRNSFEILDTTPRSIFVNLATSQNPDPSWGVILKSDSSGTVYVSSLDFVNIDDRGKVDFMRLPALKGITLANVVADPEDAMITSRKELVTRISHNDGGSWTPLDPPKWDSTDNQYVCSRKSCSLHLHAFSSRPNARSSIGVPARPDLVISVGNVGETLAPYKDGNTFLSRDAGFTWSEIRKGTHVWAFGDSGSLLVMARDSAATDRVIYSIDEGLTWHEHKLKGLENIRVRSITASAEDSSRRFVLSGHYVHSMDAAVVVQLDFSFLTKKQCVINYDNIDEIDFELWSPSTEGQNLCLFGRQETYRRRIRDRNCSISVSRPAKSVSSANCPCTKADFECEYNHIRNESGSCILVPGTSLLPNDTSCVSGENTWYERTAYRKIGYSTCEGGVSLDRGPEHECTESTGRVTENNGLGLTRASHGWFFWNVIVYLGLVLGGTIAYGVYRCSGLARGKIRLLAEDETDSRKG